LFEAISEPIFSFFLSQFPVQGVKSPCVDAGNGTAGDLNALLAFIGTTRTDYAADTGEVDIGYHYSSVETELCAYADLVLNGLVDLDDLVVLASYWLGQCSPANAWCMGGDFNFDNGVDLNDYAFLAGCWYVFDDQAPSPDPAIWEVAPRPLEDTNDSIIMEAFQATDNWRILAVEYSFENLNVAGHDSDWRQGYDPAGPRYVAEPWIYIDSGLTAGESYTYTVITRDLAGNETDASTPESARPGVFDTNPPLPNPSEWAVEPIQTTLDSIIMEAVEAVDPEDNGVEYFFDCDVDAFDSGWQQDAGYEISGIVLSETYTFSVKTRDLSLTQNETDPSVEASVTPDETGTLPQAQWSQLPTQSATSQSVTMKAEAFGGSLGSGYVIKYEFVELDGAAGGNGREYATSRSFTDSGLVGDETYSYQVRMGLFFEPGDGSSELVNEGEFSDIASVVIEALPEPPVVDIYPPLPNPAEHASGSPYQQQVQEVTTQYYHVVTSVTATDVINDAGDTLPENEDVEYKFVCSNSTFNSGNNSSGFGDPDEIEWRNVDNVAGLTYPGVDQRPQVPQEYWAKRGLINKGETWTILVRDRLLNTAVQSQSRSIFTPAP
jgi:hypothetical protein